MIRLQLGLLFIAMCCLTGCMGYTSPVPTAGYGTVEPLNKIPPAGDQIRTAARSLADQLSVAVPEGRRMRLAVTSFRDKTDSAGPLVITFQNALRVELANLQRFDVSDEELTQEARVELQRQEDRKGVIDGKTVVRLGTAKGAEAILIGTITDALSDFQIQCEIVPLQTWVVRASATAAISKAVIYAPERPRATATKPHYLGVLYSGGGWPEVALESVACLDSRLLRFTFSFLNDGNQSVMVQPDGGREGNYVTDEIGRTGELVNISSSNQRESLTVRPGSKERCIVTFNQPDPRSRSIDLHIRWSAYGNGSGGSKTFRVSGIVLNHLPSKDKN